VAPPLMLERDITRYRIRAFQTILRLGRFRYGHGSMESKEILTQITRAIKFRDAEWNAIKPKCRYQPLFASILGPSTDTTIMHLLQAVFLGGYGKWSPSNEPKEGSDHAHIPLLRATWIF